MKKILIYATGKQGSQEGSSLEAAIENIKDGNDVLYLTCGVCMGGCMDNPCFNSAICHYCKRATIKRARKYLGNKCKIHSIDEYVSIKYCDISSHFVVDDVENVKKLSYKGVDIGYGALSSYISLTRNMEPDFKSVETLNYFNDLIKQQVLLTDILEQVIYDFSPSLFYFHNGRFAQYKPCLGVARTHKIDFICTETLLKVSGEAMKNNFCNDIPHSVKANFQHYNEFWDSFSNYNEKVSVAESFFNNRRFGKYAGDKIYVANQKHGKLPTDWNNDLENIVIFNSSEDEFCAVGKEVDNAKIYKTQLEGIKDIMSHFEQDQSKHFYLRIHPNLSNIRYSYHTDLYKLSYRNLTIVPATSDISTYALMDAASKVIVFGSTMGIESSYWKKTVICAGYALYALLDVVYMPKNTAELYTLINTVNLPTKYSENILKYGLYYMSDKHDSFKYIENGMYNYRIIGRLYKWPRYCKTLRSSFLNMIIVIIYCRFVLKFKDLSRYRCVRNIGGVNIFMSRYKIR